MTVDEQEATFARWVQNHLGILYKVARSREADLDSQQDLLQEMLLQLWRSAPAWASHCSETTWIYRVALNTAHVWCRREKRRRQRSEIVREFVTAGTVANCPIHELETQSELEFLYSAIRMLSASDASLILLYLDGLTGREMAEVVGISENYAAVKLSRARKQLAHIIKEQQR